MKLNVLKVVVACDKLIFFLISAPEFINIYTFRYLIEVEDLKIKLVIFWDIRWEMYPLFYILTSRLEIKLWNARVANAQS